MWWQLQANGSEVDNRLDQENLPVREDPQNGKQKTFKLALNTT
jgi:hypothetical protein